MRHFYSNLKLTYTFKMRTKHYSSLEYTLSERAQYTKTAKASTLCVYLNEPLKTDWVAGDSRELTYELTRFRRPADLHATITLWHACIDFLTYPSRQTSLCPSRERSQRASEDISGPFISSSFWMIVGLKVLCSVIVFFSTAFLSRVYSTVIGLKSELIIT